MNKAPPSAAILKVTGWTDERGRLAFRPYYILTERPSERVTATLYLQSYGVGGITVTPEHLISVTPAEEPNGNHFLLRGPVVRHSSAGAMALEVYDKFKRRTLVNCLASRAAAFTPIDTPFAEVQGSLINGQLTVESITPVALVITEGWERGTVVTRRQRQKRRAHKSRRRDLRRQKEKKQQQKQRQLPTIVLKLGGWALSMQLRRTS